MSLQENFELNHETLYLAVKLVDHYLVEVVSMKDKLQLIGSTAVLIASKFEVTPGLGTVLRGWGCLGEFWDREELIEGGASILVLLLPIPGAADLLFSPLCRSNGDTGVQPGWTLGWSRQEKCPWRARKPCGGPLWGQGEGAERFPPFQEQCPPCVDDFLYICDDAYKREELVAMEKSILRTLNFDINIPIPYRFLRRFAKVGAPLPSCRPPRGPPAALGGGGGVAKSRSRVLRVWGWHPGPQKNKRGKGGGSGVVPHTKKMIFLAAVCPCQHGDADAGPLPLRDDPAGVRLRPGAPLQAGRQLPAAGAHHEEPGRLGEPRGHGEGEEGGMLPLRSPPAHPASFWQTPTLEYYSGYCAQDLHPLVKRLNFLLTYQPCDKLKAVRTKYSHR